MLIFQYLGGIFLIFWAKDEVSQDQQTPQGQENGTRRQHFGINRAREDRRWCYTRPIAGLEGVKTDSVEKHVCGTFVLTS